MGFFDKIGMGGGTLVPQENAVYVHLTNFGEEVLLKPNTLDGLEYDILKAIKICQPNANAIDVKNEINKSTVSANQVFHYFSILKAKGFIERSN